MKITENLAITPKSLLCRSYRCGNYKPSPNAPARERVVAIGLIGKIVSGRESFTYACSLGEFCCFYCRYSERRESRGI